MFAKLFGSSTPAKSAEINVELDRLEKNEKFRMPYFFPGAYIFLRNDEISGKLSSSTPLNYTSVIATLIGQVRAKADDHLDQFYCQTYPLIAEVGGSLKPGVEVPFKFKPVHLHCPSYYGTNFDVRYIVQIQLFNEDRNVSKNEIPIYILNAYQKPDEKIKPMVAEIGIQGLLRIECVLHDPTFEVTSCLIGKVFFLEVKMRIVEMYLQIQREEEYNNGISGSKFTSIVAQYEIMDGMPVRGDSIAIRIYLPGIKLWPYSRRPHNTLQVYYRARFLLIDEDGKKYYKDITQNILRYL